MRATVGSPSAPRLPFGAEASLGNASDPGGFAGLGGRQENDLHTVCRSRFRATLQALQDEILAYIMSQRWFVGTLPAVMLHMH